MDTIAAQAGFTMGAVASNFATKEELFLAAFEGPLHRRAGRPTPLSASTTLRRPPICPLRTAEGFAFAAALSRSVKILVACLLVAFAIAVGVGTWLVRSIALPLYRLVAILTVDKPQ